MAIAFDAKSLSGDGTNWGTGSTATWSHTCSGSDRILFVYTFNNGNGGKPTGITYNGVALTEHQTLNTDGGGFRSSIWYLIAPATGVNNIVVTWSAGDGINNCIGASYTGVKQTGFPDSSNSGNVSSATSITVATTVVASDCWLFGAVRASNTTLSSGTNGTIRQRSLSIGSQAVVDSNGTVTTGSVNQTVNVSPSRDLWLMTVSFAPAGGGPVAKKGFMAWL